MRKSDQDPPCLEIFRGLVLFQQKPHLGPSGAGSVPLSPTCLLSCPWVLAPPASQAVPNVNQACSGLWAVSIPLSPVTVSTRRCWCNDTSLWNSVQ